MSGAVLFDFGGTLDADGVPWGKRFHEAYEAAGGVVAFEPFEVVFQASDRSLASLPEIRELGFRQTIEAQTLHLRRLLPDGYHVDSARMVNHFLERSMSKVERNRPLLRRLSRQFRLGIVSNFSGNLDRCLEELELHEFFSAVADSAIVGASKPDPRIFRLALQDLGAQAEPAWMIGDNFEADIRPAAALGLSTIWVTPSDRANPQPKLFTSRVSSLLEILEVLE